MKNGWLSDTYGEPSDIELLTPSKLEIKIGYDKVDIELLKLLKETEMFEKASRLKLKFTTTRGILTTEDLWDLTLKDLNTLAKSLNKTLKETEEEDFLGNLSKEDETVKLQFNIVYHIIKTKLKEKEEKEYEVEKKTKREKLLSLIAEKQDAEFKEKTVEELQVELEKLG